MIAKTNHIKKYKYFIIFLLLSVVFVDISRYLSWVGFKLNGEVSTYISTFLVYVSSFILIHFSLKSYWKKQTPTSIQKLIIYWFLINIINLIRGFFLADDYWDYKFLFLNGITFFIVSFLFFIGNSLFLTNYIFKIFIKYLFPLGFLLLPLTFVTNQELYSRIMIPISLFLLFIPYINNKNKILIIFISITSIFVALGFRSNIIKISFSLSLLFLYYFNIKKYYINLFNVFIFLVPFILFSLAVTGTFNIFNGLSEEKKYNLVINDKTNETLSDDTRTFLYVEVLNHINKNGNFLIGSGLSGSYKSEFFYDEGGASKGKRYLCEVGILNILLQYGIIGLLIYIVLLIKISYLAINHSSSYLAKMLGLYISFRFLNSFIEEYTQYDLNYFFFWLVIGLLSSNKFRSLNDKEIKKIFLKF